MENLDIGLIGLMVWVDHLVLIDKDFIVQPRRFPKLAVQVRMRLKIGYESLAVCHPRLTKMLSNPLSLLAGNKVAKLVQLTF